MFDASKCSRVPTIHLILDLEACHDRQMPAIGRIVEESLGVDQKATKLIAKTVSLFKHFIRTKFGISKKSHGGKHETLAGTDQGNMVSGATCRD